MDHDRGIDGPGCPGPGGTGDVFLRACARGASVPADAQCVVHIADKAKWTFGQGDHSACKAGVRLAWVPIAFAQAYGYRCPQCSELEI